MSYPKDFFYDKMLKDCRWENRHVINGERRRTSAL